MTAEFERKGKEFSELKYWEKALNQIREMRKTPDYWSVKFHNTLSDLNSDLDIALPCVPIIDVLEIIEKNIIDEYKKQKKICDSIGAHERSCFSCKHCTDIICDYTHGPYMVYCGLGLDEIDEPDYIELAFQGKCPKWDGGEMNND